MTRRQRWRGESGGTLVELLLTIVILGVAIVAIVGGMEASVVASDYHRKQTTTQALLKNAAEFLKNQQTAPFQPECTPKPDYSPQLDVFWAAREPTEAAGYQLEITKHEYWDGAVPPATAGFQSLSCSNNGLQRLTLQARSVDGRITETLEVVKRRPDA